MSEKKLKSKVAGKAKSTSKNIMDSAQQIWLAGLGAFAKAQNEGAKLFETLVKEGMALESKTRKVTGSKLDEVRGAVETTVGQVKKGAADTWDRLEKVFEDRVSRTLGRLGVPNRDELRELNKRIEDLNQAVSALGGEAPARKAPAKRAPAARKPAKPVAKAEAAAPAEKPKRVRKPAAKKAPSAPASSAS